LSHFYLLPSSSKHPTYSVLPLFSSYYSLANFTYYHYGDTAVLTVTVHCSLNHIGLAMADLALLSAVGTINFAAALFYAVTGFGHALFFHFGFRLCSLASSNAVCQEDDLPLVVLYITLAGAVLYPSQLKVLFSAINWPLALHVAVAQQVGLVFGIFVLFEYKSVWLTRVLGALMYLTALHCAVYFTEESTPPTSSVTAVVPRYDVYRGRNMAKVWTAGLVSGVFGGLVATSGPPLIFFATQSKINSLECRASFSFTGALEVIARLFYILFVQSSRSSLKSSSTLFAFLVLSITSLTSLRAGNIVAEKGIDQAGFKKCLIILLAFASVLIGIDGLSLTSSLIVSAVAAALFVLIFFVARRFGLAGGTVSSSTTTSDATQPEVGISQNNPVLHTRSKVLLTKYDTVRQEDPQTVRGFSGPCDVDDDLSDLNFFDDVDETQHGIRPLASAASWLFMGSGRRGARRLQAQGGSSSANKNPSSAASSSSSSSFFSKLSSPSLYNVLPQKKLSSGLSTVDDDDDVMF